MARITKAKQLTDRDKNILTDLVRCRVLSFEQIKREYWPEAKERTCLERLQSLVKAGYIQSGEAPEQGNEKGGFTVFWLDKKGKTWADREGLEVKNLHTHPGKYEEVAHQIRTNEVYFTLSSTERDTYRIGEVYEFELRRIGEPGIIVPDAVYTAEDGTETFVEAVSLWYTAGQVRKKAEGFGNTPTVWVCPAQRENFLRRNVKAAQILTY